MSTRAEHLSKQEEKVIGTEKYHAAVGKLILQCNHAEFMVYMVLMKYAKLKDEVARALLSGTRLRNLMRAATVVAENTNTPAEQIKDLNFLFAQIATIEELRDRIAHYATAWPDPRLTAHEVKNHSRIGRLGKAQTLLVSIQDMADACADLEVIYERLAAHALPIFKPHQYNAWKYKALQPIASRNGI